MARKKINYAEMYTLRKDGRYQGYWRDADNKRHTICDRDPEKLYYKIQEKETPPELSFKDVVEAWRLKAWDRLRLGTIDSYSPAVKRALEWMGDIAADDVQPSDIYNHLCSLNDQRYSAKTIKTQRTIYKLAYQNAIIDPKMGKIVRVNPAVGVPLPDKIKPAEKRQAPEDAMIDTIRKKATTTYFGVYPLFLIFTGFRRGEALGVTWGDIDFKEKVIHCTKAVNYSGGFGKINEPKTKAGIRTARLLDELAAALKSIKPKDAKPTDFVFCGRDPSKFMAESTYKWKWKKYCQEVGFVDVTEEVRTNVKGRKYTVKIIKPTLTAHILRHGHATILYEAGVDVYTAQRLLGHADIETTMGIYTHLRSQKEAESLQKLEAFFNPEEKDS